MSTDGPVLAFIFKSKDLDLNSDEYWLVHLLEKLLCDKLLATGCQLASSRESEAAWNSLKAQPERHHENLTHILSFIPAHALVHGEMNWDKENLQAKFTLFNVDEEITVQHKVVQNHYLLFLDSIIRDLLKPLLKSSPVLRVEHDNIEATHNFEAFKALSRAYKIWFTKRNLEDTKVALEDARVKDPNFYEPLRFLAKIFRDTGHKDEEIATIRDEAELHRRATHSLEHGEALMRLGQTFIHYQDYDQALEIYDQCQKLWNKIGASQQEVKVRSNRANIYLRKGLKEEAVAQYHQSLKLVTEDSEDHAHLLYNLGLAQSQLRQNELALGTLEEALVKARTQHNSGLMCRIYNARGAIFDDYDDPDNLERALQQYRLAEEYFSAHDDLTLLAGLKDHMAITFRKLGRLEEALAYSKQACDLLVSEKHDDHRAIAYLNRASLLIEFDDYKEAQFFAQKASELFKKVQSPHLGAVKKLLSNLREALDDQEDYGD